MSFFTKIGNTKDINLAMSVAGHDFTAIKERLTTERNVMIPDHVAIMREDTNQYLGTVGIGWEPVQPGTLYDLANELIQSTNATINGVFTMHGGSVIGISFNLAERQYIAEDTTELNFIMLTAFNGTHGLAGHATIYRHASDVACNTSNKVYNLRHTKNVHNRIEVVKNILRFYNREIEIFDKKMDTMVGHSMNDYAAVEWFRKLFPKPTSQRAENILETQVGVFIDCLHNGRGSEIVGVRGTCYGAFQALMEYINHHRSTRIHNDREEDEVRFQAIHFGSGNTFIQKGMNTLTESFIEFSEKDFMIE